jgi:hypothetical protein
MNIPFIRLLRNLFISLTIFTIACGGGGSGFNGGGQEGTGSLRTLSVKGTITDNNGKGLADVTVQDQNSFNAAATDPSGNYALEATLNDQEKVQLTVSDKDGFII